MQEKDALKWFTVQDCLQRYPTLAAETELASWGGDSALRVLRLPQSLIPYAGRVRRKYHDLFLFIKGVEDRLVANIVLRFATVDPETRGPIPGRFVYWEGMTIRVHLVPLKLIPPDAGTADAPALRRLGIDQAKFQRVLAEAVPLLDSSLEARISAA
jgi:hypothetical protein